MNRLHTHTHTFIFQISLPENIVDCDYIRWDPNDLDGLPDFMKVAFFAIYNFVDELASDIQREKGLNVHSYLEKGVLFFLCLIVATSLLRS